MAKRAREEDIVETDRRLDHLGRRALVARLEHLDELPREVGRQRFHGAECIEDDFTPTCPRLRRGGP